MLYCAIVARVRMSQPCLSRVFVVVVSVVVMCSVNVNRGCNRCRHANPIFPMYIFQCNCVSDRLLIIICVVVTAFDLPSVIVVVSVVFVVVVVAVSLKLLFSSLSLSSVDLSTFSLATLASVQMLPNHVCHHVVRRRLQHQHHK